jgi:hypothetical protein
LAGSALFSGVGLVFLMTSCEPDLDVGDWACVRAPAEQAGGEAGAAATHEAITVPWSTSFEDGFCGYSDVHGYCYADASTSGSSADAQYRLTSSPTHSGRLAATFRIDASGAGQQSRCVRQGILPNEAYYGAWFFIPAPVTSASNWNLMHFRGGDDGHGLWDVSIDRAPSGALSLFVYDFLRETKRVRTGNLLVPIGSWFHLVFFLRRAATDTGEVALYQDGQRVLQVVNIATDDSSWGQWYCGNLARALTPPDATIYVDDVTIDTKL